MYLGRVVETGPTPRALRRAEPSVHAGAARRGRQGRAGQAHVRADQGRDSVAARAAAAAAISIPRCPHAMPSCRTTAPALREIAPGRLSACSSQRHVTPRRMSTPRLHPPSTRRRAPLPLVLDSPHSGERLSRPTSTTRRRARSCARPRTRTSRGSIARRAAHRRDADRGDLSARVHRSEPQPRRHRSGAARADRGPMPLRRRARPSRASGSSGGVARGGVPMYARKLDRRRGASGASTVAGGRTTPRSCASSTSCIAAFGAVWHVNCHSMPAVGDANADDPGPRARRLRARRSRRHDLRRRSSPRSSRDAFAALGYSVAINDPYKGVEIVRKHGRPAEGRHSLQIELNRTPLHGRGHARAQRGLRAARSATSSGCRARVGRLRAHGRLVRPLDRSRRPAKRLPRRRTARCPSRAAALRTRHITEEYHDQDRSRALVVGLGALLFAAAAHAAYPERPITLIVPWAAGGGTDATARIIGDAARKGARPAGQRRQPRRRQRRRRPQRDRAGGARRLHDRHHHRRDRDDALAGPDRSHRRLVHAARARQRRSGRAFRCAPIRRTRASTSSSPRSRRIPASSRRREPGRAASGISRSPGCCRI